MCSVRGIGVADIASTSTSSRSWRRSSFWATPKRCSSSSTTSPSSCGTTSRESTRWVPTSTSTLPALEVGQHLLHLGRRPEPRHHLDPDREVAEAVAQGGGVLLGEDRGRHQHQHLAAGGGDLERRPHRHLGLAEADVAAHEPVHRLGRLEILLDGVDRDGLVVGLVVGERGLEPRHPLVVGAKPGAGGVLAARVQGQQLAGQLAHRDPGPALERRPRLAAQARERGRLAVGADVAADLGQLVVGHVQAVVAAELQVEVVADDAAHLLGVEADEPADAVVLVHDVVAAAQVGDRRERAPEPGRAARAAAAQELGGRQHRQAQAGRDEAVPERRDAEGDARLLRPGPAGAGSSADTRRSDMWVRRASPRWAKQTSTRYPARTSARSSFSASVMPVDASAGSCASNWNGCPSGISSSAGTDSISSDTALPGTYPRARSAGSRSRSAASACASSTAAASSDGFQATTAGRSGQLRPQRHQPRRDVRRVVALVPPPA